MRQHGPIHIATFADPFFAENCLVVRENGGSECWIIDPGFTPQPREVINWVRSNKLTPSAILLTHCHVDHIAGVNTIRGEWPEIPIWCPADETDMLIDPEANLSAGHGLPITAPHATREIRVGETLPLGDVEFEVRDVAGHSPGGRAYCALAAEVAIVGDALFAGSIGRTDFPGSSLERLLANIRENLFSLPEATTVYPGHGPTTTIGAERETNPFLQPGFRG